MKCYCTLESQGRLDVAAVNAGWGEFGFGRDGWMGPQSFVDLGMRSAYVHLVGTGGMRQLMHPTIPATTYPQQRQCRAQGLLYLLCTSVRR